MEIGLLLKRYAHLGFNQRRIKEIVLTTLRESFSIELEDSDVQVVDTEVKIKVSGVRKAHMTLLRGKIEEAIQKDLQKEGLFVSKLF